MSKTKIITDKNQLLKSLRESDTLTPYPGFKAEWIHESGKPSALRVQFSRIIDEDDTTDYQLYIVLQPNRQLLQPGKPAPGTIVLSPHIPGSLAQELRACGIAHADLNGRLFLLGGTHLVDIRAKTSTYRNEQRGPDPFSPKASRIIRTFLSRREELLTQDELVEITRASRALVSKVLAQLVDDDYVEQLNKATKTQSAHYKLKQFDRLLDTWKDKDDWVKRVTIHQYSVLSDSPDSIARKLTSATGTRDVAFTQWFAAWQRRPHATASVVSAYLKDLSLLDVIPGRPVNSGGNLWIIVPKDEGVFQNTIDLNGFQQVCDVQTYLDLITAGMRGPEAAKELRTWEGFSR